MGGSLKFKGDAPSKKKKKSKSGKEAAGSSLVKDSETSSKLAEPSKAELQSRERIEAAASPIEAHMHELPDDGKTEAERRFEREQLKRLARRAEKEAHRSHKDRVAEFNAKLESLSEHHDIPKVGPG